MTVTIQIQCAECCNDFPCEFDSQDDADAMGVFVCEDCEDGEPEDDCEDDGQPSEYTEWQDVFGGDDAFEPSGDF
jgi:hypothetical protein